MGSHWCELCDGSYNNSGNLFPKTSSGDVNLTFKNGHKWVMPDMILHYVADHKWQPPQEFVEDVMNGELLRCDRTQTRDMGFEVGYLSGEIIPGVVPEKFIENLESLMEIAAGFGMRAQTKGINRGL